MDTEIQPEPNPPTLDQVRAAQAQFLENAPVPVSGVGITRRDGNLGLKVNILHEEDRNRIPSSVGEVPVVRVQVVGKIKASK